MNISLLIELLSLTPARFQYWDFFLSLGALSHINYQWSLLPPLYTVISWEFITEPTWPWLLSKRFFPSGPSLSELYPPPPAVILNQGPRLTQREHRGELCSAQPAPPVRGKPAHVHPRKAQESPGQLTGAQGQNLASMSRKTEGQIARLSNQMWNHSPDDWSAKSAWKRSPLTVCGQHVGSGKAAPLPMPCTYLVGREQQGRREARRFGFCSQAAQVCWTGAARTEIIIEGKILKK